MTKIRQAMGRNKETAAFVQEFQATNSLDGLKTLANQHADAHGRIAQAAISAANYASVKTGTGLIDAESPSELREGAEHLHQVPLPVVEALRRVARAAAVPRPAARPSAPAEEAPRG